jgi:acyl carrier protein
VTQPEILSRLQEVFDGVFLDPVQVTPALTAKDVPEWDSLLHVSLVLAIESAFKVRFRVGEVEGTRNIGELAALIERRLAG